MDDIFANIDVSGSDTIEFSEFMLGAIDRKKLLSIENLAIVFRYFDNDFGGSICKHEIQKVLSSPNGP